MFVLLSRVEYYVSADEMSLPRNIARACVAITEESKRLKAADASSRVVNAVAVSDGRTLVLDDHNCCGRHPAR